MSEPRTPLEAAVTPADIISAIVDAIWEGAGEPPALDLDTLSAWLDLCPDDAAEAAAAAALEVLGGRWLEPRWSRVESSPARDVCGPMALMATGTRGGRAIVGIRHLAELHRRWADSARGTRPRHPLAPLVRAWLDSPRAAEVSRRVDALLPVVRIREPQERRAGRLLGPLAGDLKPAQLPLPFPVNGTPDIPLLSISDAAGLPVLSRGRGAPLVLRIAIESLIAIPVDRREHCRVAVTVRELRDGLYPSGWKRSRDWPRIRSALQVLDQAWIPVEDENGPAQWRPWALRRMPGDGASLDSFVVMDIALPIGSHSGPQIDRRDLRRLGLDSGPRYRAYVGAHSVAWIPGRTRVPWSGADAPRIWSTDVSRYPVLTAEDRRRIAVGTAAGNYAQGRIDAAFEQLPGVEVISRSARDPRYLDSGWIVLPSAAAAAVRRAQEANEEECR